MLHIESQIVIFNWVIKFWINNIYCGFCCHLFDCETTRLARGKLASASLFARTRRQIHSLGLGNIYFRKANDVTISFFSNILLYDNLFPFPRWEACFWQKYSCNQTKQPKKTNAICFKRLFYLLKTEMPLHVCTLNNTGLYFI